jgi:hypothetical protein
MTNIFEICFIQATIDTHLNGNILIYSNTNIPYTTTFLGGNSFYHHACIVTH